MKWFNRLAFPLSLILLWGVWHLIYPWCRYNLDSDCVAYLTMANRGAQGDFWGTINGLWSPLNSWMLIPWIRAGWDTWQAALYLNLFIGTAILFANWILFNKHTQLKAIAPLFQISLSLILPFLCFFQMFGDLLQVLIVLLMLLIPKSNGSANLLRVIGMALVAGLGFYAKAYTAIWFGVFWIIWNGYQWRKGLLSGKLAIISVVVAGFTVLVCLLPWGFAMKKKYGEFALTGFAGKMNMSWFINSGKSFRNDIHLLIPPHKEGSPSFWEDPYPTQSHLNTPISSTTHFLKWGRRIVYNLVLLSSSLNEMHILALSILFAAGLYLKHKKSSEQEPDSEFMAMILIAAITLPIGYVLISVETRYLWLEILFFGILSAWILPWLQKRISINVLYAIFFLGFLIYPLRMLDIMKDKNKGYFETAEWIKAIGLHGNFTSNQSDAGPMWVIAYLSGNSFFTIERSDYSLIELKHEMKRYGVAYFLHNSENNVVADASSDADFKKIAGRNGLDVYAFLPVLNSVTTGVKNE